MYENIRHHSFMVARVADLVLGGLQQTFPDTSTIPKRELVIAGALLHDIAKTQCLIERCHHSLVGAEICLELGLDQLAEIVRDHVLLPEFNMDRYVNGIFTAKELVFYADKRINHDQVVSLDERKEYIVEKYGRNELVRLSVITENFNKCKSLEDHLFSFLDFEPDEVQPLLLHSATELHYP